ncbi:hypothetical protein ACSMXM_01275 [Pacificimonas sp. ICDLI1SI03]
MSRMSLAALYRFANMNGATVRSEMRFVARIVQVRLRLIPLYGDAVTRGLDAAGLHDLDATVDRVAALVLQLAEAQEAARPVPNVHRNRLAERDQDN